MKEQSQNRGDGATAESDARVLAGLDTAREVLLVPPLLLLVGVLLPARMSPAALGRE